MSQTIIIENLPYLSIKKLAGFGLLSENSRHSDQIRVSNIVIDIIVCTHPDSSSLRLRYNLNDQQIDYKLILVQVPNNIGEDFSGSWYFLCPFTGLRCRKIYFDGQHFIHRKGIPYGLYYQQTLSRNHRDSYSQGKKFQNLQNALNDLGIKYFISHYAGTETKRFRKAQAKLSLVMLPN